LPYGPVMLIDPTPRFSDRIKADLSL
jgi:hypothetical protein